MKSSTKASVGRFARFALCAPLFGGLVACQAPNEPNSVAASADAIAVFTEAQQRFVLPQIDYRARLSELAGAPRLAPHAAVAKMQPVLASRSETPLQVRDGRIAATNATRLRVSSGTMASDPVELAEMGSGMKVRMHLERSAPIRGELVDGYIVYRGGHESGADVIHQIAAARHEDFLIFHAPPVTPTVRYQLELNAQVAGLRLVDDVLELLDGNGIPRLRMKKPYTVDDSGVRQWAKVDVEGCNVDRDGRPPFDRAVTAPGAASCTVAVTWDAGAQYPLLLDPVWTTTGSMAAEREGFVMVLLPTGNVLAAGGGDGFDILSSAEVYSVAGGAWATTTAMPKGRYGAEAVSPGANITTLGDPIFIGGYFESATETLATTVRVDRYNSSAGTWSTFTQLASGRVGHSATLYTTSSGAVNVMVAGGYNETNGILTTTERGTGTGAWTAGTYGGATLRRTNHTMTRLSNGRLVMAGGFGGSASDTTHNTCRLYNNSLNSWGTTVNLNVARRDHTATLLLDGRILVAGGVGTSNAALDSAEAYTASPAAWANIASPMSFQRAGHEAVRLTDGVVLLAGGIDASGTILDSAELFDPSTDEFFLFGDTASSPRVFHGQTLLNDGRVLLCGGYANFSTGNPLSTCEFYDATGD